MNQSLTLKQGLIVLLFALLGAWAFKQAMHPSFNPCPDCEGTGALSCGAEDCVHGRVLCTGPCLRKESEGWQHLEVKGHSPQELWMVFNNPDGSWTAWTQAHVGQAVEMIDGHWTNTGPCKVCGGTTRMPCPVCKAQKYCARCDGTGRLRRWLF